MTFIYIVIYIHIYIVYIEEETKVEKVKERAFLVQRHISAMSYSAGGVDGLNNENKQSMSGNNHHVVRRIIEVILLFVGVAVLSLVTYKSAYPLRFLPKSYYYPSASPPSISPIPVSYFFFNLHFCFLSKQTYDMCYYLIQW